MKSLIDDLWKKSVDSGKEKGGIIWVSDEVVLPGGIEAYGIDVYPGETTHGSMGGRRLFGLGA